MFDFLIQFVFKGEIHHVYFSLLSLLLLMSQQPAEKHSDCFTVFSRFSHRVGEEKGFSLYNLLFSVGFLKLVLSGDLVNNFSFCFQTSLLLYCHIKNGSRDTSYTLTPVSDSVKVFQVDVSSSRADPSVIRTVCQGEAVLGGEDRHYGAEDRRKRTEVSNLEKVQGLGSRSVSLIAPFLPHRPAT